MVDMISLGETMVCFQSFEDTLMKYSNVFRKSIAGAESNVAIALSRLGFNTKWISTLGEDAFADMIKGTLISENIDVDVEYDDKHSTGIFFKEYKGYGETKVLYYRKQSAASKMNSELFSRFLSTNGKIKHFTGITLALSNHNAEHMLQALSKKEIHGKISFDPNIRKKLWSIDEAKISILKILPYVDYYFPSEQEFKLLHGLDVTEENMIYVKELFGLELLVVKTGEGAKAIYESYVEFKGEKILNVKDTAGAGDAFASGVLAYMLEHEDLVDEIELCRWGHTMGSLAVQSSSDWETLPSKKELMELLYSKINDER